MQPHSFATLRNPPDNRDIRLTSVQAHVVRPKKNKTSLVLLPVENQKDHGSCVGQGEGKGAEYFQFKEEGKVVRLSKRYLYGEAKKIDGFPEIEGTYPRVVASILTSRGVPREIYLPDLNDLSHEAYHTYDLSEEIEFDAFQYRVSGYAAVEPELEALAQAIYQNGVVSASLDVANWSRLPVKPTPSTGLHRILLYGYEEKWNWFTPDIKIFFRNSWGKEWGDNGNGWFWLSEFREHIYDIMAYVDMPNVLRQQAKLMPYLFTRTLKKGSTGPDVTQLQLRLNAEVAKDGKPCYDYKEAGSVYYGTYFGVATETAVQRYQIAKGIVLSGTPATTGFGAIGPTTIKVLNGPDVGQLYPKVRRMRDALISKMKSLGSPIVVTQEYRSIAEQDSLYAQGRTKPGAIVTNAKGGESYHNWRVAFDIAFVKGSGVSYDGPWSEVSKQAKALGLEWGGEWASFPDRPHFQFTGGYTCAQFKAGTVDYSKLA